MVARATCSQHATIAGGVGRVVGGLCPPGGNPKGYGPKGENLCGGSTALPVIDSGSGQSDGGNRRGVQIGHKSGRQQ